MGDQTAADFLEGQGIYVTPVLSVDGTLVIGFQRERIAALLGIVP
jgi:hypothetical protein